MGRVTRKRVARILSSGGTLPLPSDFVRGHEPSVSEDTEDWQAVVRRAFATRVCPNCRGILNFFEVGEVSGLRCRECGWGFEHVHNLASDTCHYYFSVPTAVKRSAS